MDEWMWSGETGRWHDVEWEGRGQLQQVSAASFTPLWACQHSAEREAAAVQSLRRSGLVREGGVATTLVESGEQWGGPAAWLRSSTASRLQL